MKKFFQIFLVFLFTLFVIWLGIFAFKLSNDALVFAFYNEENQKGDTLTLSVHRPGMLSKIVPAGTLLDIEALKKSLLLNGNELTHEEREGLHFTEGDGFFRVHSENLSENDILMISADLYNSLKKTSYRLARNVTLTYSYEKEEDFFVSAKWEPKKTLFQVSQTSNSEDIDFEKIKWYAYYPLGDAQCFRDDIFWNAKNFSPIKSKKIISENQDIQEDTMTFELDFNTTKNKQCLIAGFGGKIVSVIDRELDDFDFSASVVWALIPENNFDTEIAFTTSSSLLGASENISQEKKQNFLKHITLSPSVELSVDNIEIFENSLHIRANFQEGKTYTVHVTDIEDIFWRKSSWVLRFTPESNPFLSLKLNKDTYNTSENIPLKISSVQLQNQDIELKVCRLDLDGYFELESLISEEKNINLEKIYSILYSSHATECQKNAISLSKTEIQTDIALRDVFSNLQKSWLYVVVLWNQEFASSFQNFVKPQLFTISDNRLIWNILPDNHMQFLVFHENTMEPQANQKIEIYHQIQKNLWENNNIFATGVVVGETDNNGILSIANNFDTQTDSWDLFVAIARGNNGISWVEKLVLPQKIHEGSEKIILDKKNYAPWETVYVSIFSHENNPATLEVKIFNSQKVLQKSMVAQGNEFWTLVTGFLIPENAKDNFFIELSEVKTGKILQNKTISVVKNIFIKPQINIELRAFNTENGVLKNLRKIKNTDENTLWYDSAFSAPLQLEARIHILDDQKKNQKNKPFSYQWYRKTGGKTRELLKEWESKTDSDGLGLLLFDTTFLSTYDDVEYILEIHTVDALSGEEIQDKQSTIITLPREYKTFSDTILPTILLQKSLINREDWLDIQINFDREWSESLKNIYQIEIYNKKDNVLVFSEKLDNDHLHLDSHSWQAGEYQIFVFPIIPDEIEVPEKMKAEKKFYIFDDNNFQADNIDIVNETITWKILEATIISPREKWKILATLTANHQSFSQIINFSGSVIPVKFSLDDEIIWKASLGVQIFSSNERINISWEKILQSNQVVPTKISTNLWNQTIKQGTGILVDVNFHVESLQENEFFLKITKNTWEQNGGHIWKSGNIFDNENFLFSDVQGKTAFFAYQITKTQSGILNFNVWNLESGNYILDVFRVGKNGNFSHSREYFSVTQDYRISALLPEFAYPNDVFQLDISVENATNILDQTELVFSLNNQIISQKNIVLNIGKNTATIENIKIPDTWRGKIPYSLKIIKNNVILNEQKGDIFINEIPYMGWDKKFIGNIDNEAKIHLSVDTFLDKQLSNLSIIVWKNLSFIVPDLLEDLKNSQKTSTLENIDFFALQSFILKYFPQYSDITMVDFEKKFSDWIWTESFESWKNQKNIDTTLEIIEKFLEICEILPNVGNLLLSDIEKFIEHIKNTPEEYAKHLVKMFLIEQKISGKLSKESQEKMVELTPENMNIGQLFDYFALLQSQWMEISDENWQLAQQKIYEDHKDYVYNLQDSLKLHLVFLLFKSWKNNRAQEILQTIFTDEIPTVSSLHYKKYAILSALYQSRLMGDKEVNVSFELPAVTAKEVLNKEKNFHIWSLAREKVRGDLLLKTDVPHDVFYQVKEKNILEAPALFSQKISKNLQVSRKIDEVVEWGWQDKNGNYLLVQEKQIDEPLEKGKLYKITTEVSVHHTDGKKYGTIELRESVPAGSQIFLPIKNASFALQKNENGILLLTLPTNADDKKWQYVYYFRPRITQNSLLPANFVYFKEKRESFAHGSHNYITIK